MTTFVLIPGAGGAGEDYWVAVAELLRERGHTAIPVEIQGDDPALGLPEYADHVDEAIGEHRDVVLVAQSLGGFTAPMITRRQALSRVVLVNAMIPVPGETPGDWWGATGSEEARKAANAAAGLPDELDIEALFLHDLSADAIAAMSGGDREPAETPFGQPCTFVQWPAVPLHVLVGADDRLFPADFQVRVARERLGIAAEVIPGGHLVARSQPELVCDRLLAYAGHRDERAGDGDGAPAEAADQVAFSLADAAAEVRRVSAAVRPEQWGDPTPCSEWNVRQLAGHICGLVAAFTEVARHEVHEPASTDGGLKADWQRGLAKDLDALVAAWQQPSAWVGEAEAGGIRMPSAELAAVALDELVLHGWDLARATGQRFTATDADVAICTGFAAAMSTPETLDSRGGLYGPLVHTPADASPFETLLGLAGRDPRWRPPVRC